MIISVIILLFFLIFKTFVYMIFAIFHIFFFNNDIVIVWFTSVFHCNILIFSITSLWFHILFCCTMLLFIVPLYFFWSIYFHHKDRRSIIKLVKLNDNKSVIFYINCRLWCFVRLINNKNFIGLGNYITMEEKYNDFNSLNHLLWIKYWNLKTIERWFNFHLIFV